VGGARAIQVRATYVGSTWRGRLLAPCDRNMPHHLYRAPCACCHRTVLIHEVTRLRADLRRAEQAATDARTKDVVRIERLAQTNTSLQAQLQVRSLKRAGWRDWHQTDVAGVDCMCDSNSISARACALFPRWSLCPTGAQPAGVLGGVAEETGVRPRHEARFGRGTSPVA